MIKIEIPYSEAYKWIREADVAFFEGDAWYSHLIIVYTGSPYSHVGLLSWHNSGLELVDFHGRRGGTTAQFYRRLEEYGKADIYRASSSRQEIKWNSYKKIEESQWIDFNGKCITNTMRDLTGLPYGWKRMWWFAKRYLVGLRLFYNTEDIMDDKVQAVVAPVCSTAVAYSFSANNFDLNRRKADRSISPGELATSASLHYMFTVVVDEK